MQVLTTIIRIKVEFLMFSILVTAPALAEPVIDTYAGGAEVLDGGPATDAVLSFPTGIAFGPDGAIYFTDETVHVVRRVDLGTGIITTVAGNGTAGFSGNGGLAKEAQLNLPIGLALDSIGNIYFAEKANHVIRRVDVITGIISTAAGTTEAGYNGDGVPADQAQLKVPVEVVLDRNDNLYIADQKNHRVRKVDAVTGLISTIAGTGQAGFSGDGSLASAAQLSLPSGIAVGYYGRLFIADKGNQRVRTIHPFTGVISTTAGTGTRGFSGDGGSARFAKLAQPANVELDPWGNLFIADEANNVIRKIRRTTGIIDTYVGVPFVFGYNGDGILATDATLLLPTGFSSPGIAFDRSGHLYLADRGNQRIRKVNVYTKGISTIAGGGDIGNGGVATDAHIVVPAGLALTPAGVLYIADRGNNMLRVVDPVTGIITAVAGTGEAGYSGDGGPAGDAQLDLPMSVVTDAAGNIYVSDQFNHVIRRIDIATGTITTAVGNGLGSFSGDGGPAENASLNLPLAIDFDSLGNLWIADQYNSRVRRVDMQTGIITTVAGNGSAGYGGDGGPALSAALGLPSGLALDINDNIYIADRQHSAVRRIDATTGIITRVAGIAIEGLGGLPGYSGDGGRATVATLRFPTGLDVDDAGNIFIADFGNGAIRRVDGVSGLIETVAGTGEPGFSGDGGPPTEAQLNLPLYVLVSEEGNFYIGDVPNNRVRRVIMEP